MSEANLPLNSPPPGEDPLSARNTAINFLTVCRQESETIKKQLFLLEESYQSWNGEPDGDAVLKLSALTTLQELLSLQMLAQQERVPLVAKKLALLRDRVRVHFFDLCRNLVALPDSRPLGLDQFVLARSQTEALIIDVAEQVSAVSALITMIVQQVN